MEKLQNSSLRKLMHPLKAEEDISISLARQTTFSIEIQSLKASESTFFTLGGGDNYLF
jgi:hypothetical protein